MRIKDTYVLRCVAGENLVVPLGSSTVSFNSIITLNESGKFLWEQLSKHTTEQALTDALLSVYEIDRKTAEKDVLSFVKSLRDNGILEE